MCSSLFSTLLFDQLAKDDQSQWILSGRATKGENFPWVTGACEGDKSAERVEAGKASMILEFKTDG